MSKAAKKNAKRKEKKKQQDGVQPATENSGPAVVNIAQQFAKTSLNTNKAAGDKQDTLRKVRQLRKKLKQIEDLERRVASGELQPDGDQKEKMSKKAGIVKEMELLQADLDEWHITVISASVKSAVTVCLSFWHGLNVCGFGGFVH